MRTIPLCLPLLALPWLFGCAPEAPAALPSFGEVGGSAGSPVSMAGAGGLASAGAAGVLVQVGGGGAAGSGGAAGDASGGTGGAGGSLSSVVDPGTDGDGIFELTGPYTAAPELQRQNDAAEGTVLRFTIESSTIYPNAPARDIAAYVPKQYQPGTPAPVMVIQDGTDFYGFDSMMPPVFDNLISQGKLPPLVVVFAGNGGGDSVGSERGLEYDTVSGLYAEWADRELLPRVEAESLTQLPDQPVTLTKDPEGRGALGGSSGGAASFSMAWWRPDLFRRVITFSGTYVNQVPKDSPFPHGAWVYHDIDPYDPARPNGLIAAFCEATTLQLSGAVGPCDTPLSAAACSGVSGCAWNTDKNKPIRIWLQAGSNDNGASGPPSSYRNFHLANQRMAQALVARGYHVHFDDCEGAGHVDQGPLRQTLPTALTWLWRGYVGGL